MKIQLKSDVSVTPDVFQYKHYNAQQLNGAILIGTLDNDNSDKVVQLRNGDLAILSTLDIDLVDED